MRYTRSLPVTGFFLLLSGSSLAAPVAVTTDPAQYHQWLAHVAIFAAEKSTAPQPSNSEQDTEFEQREFSPYQQS